MNILTCLNYHLFFQEFLLFVGASCLVFLELRLIFFHSVLADENRLAQILHNLIGNAIKFTEKGRVTVSAEKKEGLIHIAITDTGIGIPEDKQGIIFQSFEQAWSLQLGVKPAKAAARVQAVVDLLALTTVIDRRGRCRYRTGGW